MRNYDLQVATKHLDPNLKLIIPFNSKQFVLVTDITFNYENAAIYLEHKTGLPAYQLARLQIKLQSLPIQAPIYYRNKHMVYRVWGYRLIIQNNLLVLN
ncbi:hypothetical protein JOC59_001233 [Weissella beninensis]|uniref:Uncharacterized protein n=1 Tax=Periweissella beninensis TaxID=504936 RepID=A0ABT0VJK7_9LACO|nr:hypothetical protein [Periweissella beninensis]MBM7544516.1 hypothetical protein [Periweissella beninensis]MCM2438014.1 hypothetical protein [Periweissella beninensis]